MEEEGSVCRLKLRKVFSHKTALKKHLNNFRNRFLETLVPFEKEAVKGPVLVHKPKIEKPERLTGPKLFWNEKMAFMLMDQYEHHADYERIPILHGNVRPSTRNLMTRLTSVYSF